MLELLAKIKLGEVDAKEVRVSGDTVSTAWYAQEIVGGKLFYLDSSALGSSYVHYIALNAEVKSEDTDDNGEDDLTYLVGATFIGQMIESDLVSMAVSKINNIANELENGALPYETVDGQLTVCRPVDSAECTTIDSECSIVIII